MQQNDQNWKQQNSVNSAHFEMCRINYFLVKNNCFLSTIWFWWRKSELVPAKKAKLRDISRYLDISDDISWYIARYHDISRYITIYRRYIVSFLRYINDILRDISQKWNNISSIYRDISSIYQNISKKFVFFCDISHILRYFCILI